MIYYKYLISKDFESKRKDIADEKRIETIINSVDEINSSFTDNSFSMYFINEDPSTITLAFSLSYNCKIDVEKEIMNLLGKIDIISFSISKKEEITTKEFAILVGEGTKKGYINDQDSVCQKLAVGNKRYCVVQKDFKEEMIEDDIISDIVFKSIEEEKKRILSPYSPKEFIGHPVHYIIAADYEELRAEMRRQLLHSLYKANRLKSRRVSLVTLNPLGSLFSERYSDIGSTVNKLYSKGDGGTVVISSPDIEDEDEDEFFTPSIATEIEGIAFSAYSGRDSVLTIIELDSADENTLKELSSLTDRMDFVILREDLVFNDYAKSYLKTLAEKDGIKDTRSLLERVKEDEGYHYSNLSSIYRKWKEDKKKEAFPVYKDFISDRTKEKKDEVVGKAYRDLQSLIGLGNAKNVIDEAIAYSNMQKLMADRKINIPSPSRHMVFYGSPGTAKTTVARLFAQIMKDNGVLSKGELVEVGRKDLVGKYVGWTAKQVEEIFKKAEDSVLFIDEAYSLIDGRDKLYGQEAINTIVQMMENMRENTIVIFAGYEKEMKDFLDQNPGLRSRIPFHVHFDSYTESELLEILRLTAAKSNYTLTKEAEAKAKEIFKTAIKHEDFGNGRFVRNLFEKATMKKALRVSTTLSSSISDTELMTLREEDFIMPEEYTGDKKSGILGFSA